ncbi:MAG: ubiquinol-cytochrome c reductase iron-sulfur subunit [Alphaproteobacteria bacterium]|nr:ubiquinol-cytochrome c reductase iron-sulfur subunit [Alphaproteobacteria bacterium]
MAGGSTTTSAHAGSHGSSGGGDGASRRDFLALTGNALLAVGAGSVGYAFVDYMNPSADVLALASTEVDVSQVAPGMSITVTWRGKPVFIRHRTAEEIKAAETVNAKDLPDPAVDKDRVKKKELLVLVGVCTHLGCVPLGQKVGDLRGEFGGWFCPCHGSHYDTSGRIRKGPAPANLEVPAYDFVSDKVIRIG